MSNISGDVTPLFILIPVSALVSLSHIVRSKSITAPQTGQSYPAFSFHRHARSEVSRSWLHTAEHDCGIRKDIYSQQNVLSFNIWPPLSNAPKRNMPLCARSNTWYFHGHCRSGWIAAWPLSGPRVRQPVSPGDTGVRHHAPFRKASSPWGTFYSWKPLFCLSVGTKDGWLDRNIIDCLYIIHSIGSVHATKVLVELCQHNVTTGMNLPST